MCQIVRFILIKIGTDTPLCQIILCSINELKVLKHAVLCLLVHISFAHCLVSSGYNICIRRCSHYRSAHYSANALPYVGAVDVFPRTCPHIPRTSISFLNVLTSADQAFLDFYSEI